MPPAARNRFGLPSASGTGWFHLTVCLLFAGWLTLTHAHAATEVGPDATMAFDIPEQLLGAAIERYGAISGRQVVYDGTLAVGRRSTAVEGVFTPAEALRILLTGTGLEPHYVASDGFFLSPGPAPETVPPREANTAAPAVVIAYYGRIQAALRQAFCTSDVTRAGGYHIAVSFWIGPSGGISRIAPLGSTGRPELDQEIGQTLQNVVVQAPPPEGFAQPIVLVVTPALAQDCQAAEADSDLSIGGDR